jgi:hypothetical protein
MMWRYTELYCLYEGIFQSKGLPRQTSTTTMYDSSSASLIAMKTVRSMDRKPIIPCEATSLWIEQQPYDNVDGHDDEDHPFDEQSLGYYDDDYYGEVRTTVRRPAAAAAPCSSPVPPLFHNRSAVGDGGDTHRCHSGLCDGAACCRKAPSPPSASDNNDNSSSTTIARLSFVQVPMVKNTKNKKESNGTIRGVFSQPHCWWWLGDDIVVDDDGGTAGTMTSQYDDPCGGFYECVANLFLLPQGPTPTSSSLLQKMKRKKKKMKTNHRERSPAATT